MSRNKNLRRLVRDLEYLHRQDVQTLMKVGEKQKLLNIAKKGFSSGKVNFTMIKNFVKYRGQGLALTVDEIQDQYLFELIFYANQTRLADCYIFDSWQQWHDRFEKSEDDFLQHIARLMEFDSLGSYSLEELLYGIPEEKG